MKFDKNEKKVNLSKGFTPGLCIKRVEKESYKNNSNYEFGTTTNLKHGSIANFEDVQLLNIIKDHFGVLLTKDYKITRAVFSHMTKDYLMSDIEAVFKKVKNYINAFDTIKALSNEKATNKTINTIIEENLNILNNWENYTKETINSYLLNSENSIDGLKQKLKQIEKYDIVYAGLHKLGFSDFEVYHLCMQVGLNNIDVTKEEFVRNITFLKNVCKVEELNYDKFKENVVNNLTLLLNLKPNVLENYISVFSLAGLDNEIISNELSFIGKLMENNITYYNLYPYVMKAKNEIKYNTTDSLAIIIDNFNYDVLKKEYPTIKRVKGQNHPISVIDEIKRNYIKQLNEKVENRNKIRRKNMKSKTPFSNAEDFSAIDDNYNENYDSQATRVTLSNKEKALIEEQCEKYNVPFKIFKSFAEKENAMYNKNGINKYKYHIVFLELNNLLEDYVKLIDKSDDDCMNLFFMPTKDVYAKIEYLKNEDKENFDILSVLDFNYLDADEFEIFKKKYTYTKEELKDMNNKYDFLWNMKKHIKKNKRVRAK